MKQKCYGGALVLKKEKEQKKWFLPGKIASNKESIIRYPVIRMLVCTNESHQAIFTFASDDDVFSLQN